MPSSRKIEANRANARRSTGPRTAGGRLRASLNALKHGLAVPASAHPSLQHDIDQLAQLLAGEAKDDPVVMVRALKVAEAMIEVQRARRARLDLLRLWNLSTGQAIRAAPADPVPEPKPVRRRVSPWVQEMDDEEVLQRLKLAEHAIKALKRAEKTWLSLGRFRLWTAPYATWGDLLRQLERLDRYERRARSRCDRAIKEFDSMKTKAMSI